MKLVKFYQISNFAQTKLARSNKRFKDALGCHYKMHIDRCIAFLSYLENNANTLKALEKEPNGKRGFGVKIYSKNIYKFFGDNMVATKALRILKEIGLIDVKVGYKCEYASTSSTYYPCSQYHRTSYVPINEFEYDRLEGVFDDFFKDHQLHLSEEYQALKNDFGKLYINFEKAGSVFEQLYGMSLKDVEDMKANGMPVRNLDVMKAIVSYNQLWLIQSKTVRFKTKYGRVYTPVHSLPKKLRDCLEVNHEEVVELFDAKACFPRICAELSLKLAKENNDALAIKELSELIDFMSKGGDIYTSISTNGVTRPDAKLGTMYTMFSTPSGIKWLKGIEYRFSNQKDSDKTAIINRCLGIKEEIRKNYIKDGVIDFTGYQYEKEINAISGVSKCLTGEKKRKKVLTTTSRSLLRAKAIVPIHESILAKYPNFVKYTTILKKRISDKNKSKIDNVKSFLKGKAKYIGERINFDRSIIASNLSIEAQKIESKIFIDTMLPELRKMFGDVFITIHDAIMCKKSVAERVDKEGLVQVYNHLMKEKVSNHIF